MKSNIELLFRTHYRALCLFATHYIGDISVAEDIVMEAFLHFTERVEQGTTVKEPKSYLFQIVRNSCYNFVRQQRPKCSPVNETTEAVVDDNGDELAEQSAREARLWEAIDHLSPMCRHVFLLSKRDGKKYSEIAQYLGISVKTVEAHVSKAYSILRKQVTKFNTPFFM